MKSAATANMPYRDPACPGCESKTKEIGTLRDRLSDEGHSNDVLRAELRELKTSDAQTWWTSRTRFGWTMFLTWFLVSALAVCIAVCASLYEAGTLAANLSWGFGIPTGVVVAAYVIHAWMRFHEAHF